MYFSIFSILLRYSYSRNKSAIHALGVIKRNVWGKILNVEDGGDIGDGGIR